MTENMSFRSVKSGDTVYGSCLEAGGDSIDFPRSDSHSSESLNASFASVFEDDRKSATEFHDCISFSEDERGTNTTNLSDNDTLS